MFPVVEFPQLWNMMHPKSKEANQALCFLMVGGAGCNNLSFIPERMLWNASDLIIPLILLLLW